MLNERDLKQEVEGRFGSRVVRHTTDKLVLVSQLKRKNEPHISGDHIKAIVDGLAQMPDLFSPNALKTPYEYAKEHHFGSFRDPYTFALGPQGWMQYAGEAIIGGYFDRGEVKTPISDLERFLNSGVQIVAGLIPSVARNPDTSLSFDIEHGITSDGRRVISACPAVKESRKMFVAFYDVMKNDVRDPSGRLRAAVSEMQNRITHGFSTTA
jgi:hypothetical protein